MSLRCGITKSWKLNGINAQSICTLVIFQGKIEVHRLLGDLHGSYSLN